MSNARRSTSRPFCEPPPGTVSRDALLARLDSLPQARLSLITAPVGTGKTVLLRQLAAHGTTERVLIECATLPSGGLVAALGARLELATLDLDELLDGMAGLHGERTILVDDAHLLKDGPEEYALTRLITDTPGDVRFVVTTRDDRAPALTDVADVPGPVRRLGYADLRFTPAEVERLFESEYRSPLPAGQAAALCARVEGLPIALRLVHLDTVLLPAAQRTAAYAAPLAASARLRTFLEREVLGDLPESTREFMVEISPLGVLDAALCDRLLGRKGSGDLLAELAGRQALTFRGRAAGQAYRFHTLLQQHLELGFLERHGGQLTRRAYATAAHLLASAGHWPEAYRCLARAGDWVASADLLHRHCARREALHTATSLRPVMFEDDPWIALAQARQLRGEGRLAAAWDLYLSVENRLPDRSSRWQCALERSVIAPWVAGDVLSLDGSPLVDGVSPHFAAALRGNPARLLAHAVSTPGPEWALGRAMAAILDGRLDMAGELAEPLVHSSPPFVALAARLLLAAMDAIAHGTGTTTTLTELAADAETSGWPWVARAARATAAVLDTGYFGEAAAIVEECDEVGDVWGALLAAIMLALGRFRAGTRAAPAALAEAARRARRLGASVPETWLRVVLAYDLEQRGHPDASAESEHARTTGVPLPSLRQQNRVISALREPRASRRHRLSVVPRPVAPVAVRCLGGFEIAVRGVPLDLGGLRAQARRVLRVLAMQCGQPIHEERLVAALWPAAPLKQAKHRLQVAISSLRALLRAQLDQFDGQSGIVRHGNAYLLRLPPGSTVDLAEFDTAMSHWRAGRHAQDPRRMRELGQEVLDLYRGELLSDEGPAEWVLARRESLRGEAAGVAAVLAQLELDHGRTTAALEICEHAVTIDELDGRLWTLLAEARGRLGSAATARRAQQAYRDLLAEG